MSVRVTLKEPQSLGKTSLTDTIGFGYNFLAVNRVLKEPWESRAHLYITPIVGNVRRSAEDDFEIYEFDAHSASVVDIVKHHLPIWVRTIGNGSYAEADLLPNWMEKAISRFFYIIGKPPVDTQFQFRSMGHGSVEYELSPQSGGQIIVGEGEVRKILGQMYRGDAVTSGRTDGSLTRHIH